MYRGWAATNGSVLHVKDVTGKAIEDALLANIAKQGVTLFGITRDLITARKARKLGVKVEGNDDRVLGIYFFDANRDRVVTVAAPVVLLATVERGRPTSTPPTHPSPRVMGWPWPPGPGSPR